MNALKDVTAYFQVEKIFDIAVVQGWIAAATGEQGLVLINGDDGTRLPLSTNLPLDGTILISGNNVFCHHSKGAYDDCASEIAFEPFQGAEALDLDKVPVPHFTFATNRCLYGLHNEGDLLRLNKVDGCCETPSSPYGRYDHSDHKVKGISPSRQGIIVLSRHAARTENLLDSLPDDPSRPKARAAVLKDSDFGPELLGPAVAGRWAHMVSIEKRSLVSIHLRNPENTKQSPLPEGVLENGPVLLAAAPEGQVLAASPLGLDIVAGPGASLHFGYPGANSGTPSRLVVGKDTALIHTSEGHVYMAEY